MTNHPNRSKANGKKRAVVEAKREIDRLRADNLEAEDQIERLNARVVELLREVDRLRSICDGTVREENERLQKQRKMSWEQNEHGLWCPACGEIIAASWNMDADYVPPESCKTCGFPDFEDGPRYFTDED